MTEEEKTNIKVNLLQDIKDFLDDDNSKSHLETCNLRSYLEMELSDKRCKPSEIKKIGEILLSPLTPEEETDEN